MRQDRSQWLGLFIGISLLIHAGAIYRSRAMPRPGKDSAQPPSIEVALQPLPDVKPPAPIPTPPKSTIKPAVNKAPVSHKPDHAPISRTKEIAKVTAVVPIVHEAARP